MTISVATSLGTYLVSIPSGTNRSNPVPRAAFPCLKAGSGDEKFVHVEAYICGNWIPTKIQGGMYQIFRVMALQRAEISGAENIGINVELFF